MKLARANQNKKNSLLRRVVRTGVGWYLLAILNVGALLMYMFEQHIEQRFDEMLKNQLYDMVAAVEVQADGQVVMGSSSSNPMFSQPLSGWYWQVIDHNNQVLFQSDSLYSEQPIPLVDHDEEYDFHRIELMGPVQKLRMGIQTVEFSQGNTHLQFLVSGPVNDITKDVYAYGKLLFFVMLILVAAVTLSIWNQVRQVLSPVKELEDNIAAIRRGEKREIDADLPQELQNFGDEINLLLAHNTAILERSRLQAANLAHALKNPISVLRHELDNISDSSAQVMSEQLNKLSQNAHTHLARARLAGSMNQLAAQTNVSESVSDILFSMELLYKRKQLQLGFRCHANLYFRGDQHDLEEVIGNVIDNACKWAVSRVQVNVALKDNRIVIEVEDDGVGIPESKREHVFKPGRRLDETTEGSGLGLNIVHDVVMLYGGVVGVESSEFGGAKVYIELPGGINDAV
ncbi:ATP-binding protein [Vibrio japonicus]|uniref:histidine kinase n=1 Tax=Vibrio japonicus TaxID=1824638 RepID=A0ABY5LHQ0_9VIBR|nr:HAMP domain-containing sensor histidine kinase [Vibrio japonicus]UUM30986.1 HAMP domain-containing histidine kinase [Vibrio japonicus]